MKEEQFFKKILVANRSEIAIRILRAISELHIQSVAIYTHEDRYSLHRFKADEAYQIGDQDDPLKPYLDIEKIILVAKQNRVDAIHPGYGFLSENQEFVRRCQEENIVFIGPTKEVMAKLGDKTLAKQEARKCQIPVIEDNHLPLHEGNNLATEAKRIGLPVMLKAVSGGGGRGMRIARTYEELFPLYEEASNEATKAFGDGAMFMEKYVEDPKHIEVQILGDNYGNIVHLLERDCSIQRRYQKVVEVAPSVGLHSKTKEKLYEYALAITSSVGYNNAGTVEFLVDKNENIFFIEVNPRIQVEHTITEEITGIDIVRTQILIAAGYELSHPQIYIESQDQIKARGFAIQCRVTTEDPEHDFKPDYGTVIAYRSPGGFGIRLDAGNIYNGVRISPFFDSLLVKITSKGRTLKGSIQRLHRALREFRVRGVKTNIGFLENVIYHPEFMSGDARVSFIEKHPELFKIAKSFDRGTKTLKYIGEISVNGNPNIKKHDPKRGFSSPKLPNSETSALRKGSRDLLKELGREKFVLQVLNDKKIHYTDTTFRDAHQSLLATRLRTKDMLTVANSYAQQNPEVFSLEMWGGATFDVAMRFLKESPWDRLHALREAIPNILFQMLLRGSNGVGYKAYPDNLIEKFIEKSAEGGMDVFRIFDSLNWIENMRGSIKTVLERTESLAEACICYTGDITNHSQKKYTLQYYLDMARELEDLGVHMLCIKDMAGLLKPNAATLLVSELKKVVDLPIHLHTHDTSSIQSATYLKAIEAGVDIVDVALSSMSGLTSQPNFNSIVSMMKGHSRDRDMNLASLNSHSVYFEGVREYYYPFESGLKHGTAEVYEHEIPGGQYSNLKPQAIALGLENKFETVKQNYKIVNELFGDIIKVTPSSKVVGDMAIFMAANNLSVQDLFDRGDSLSFPESVVRFFKGDLGIPYGGFPEDIAKVILKGESPIEGRSNEHLAPVDFENEFPDFQKEFPSATMEDFLSYQLYPSVYKEYYDHLSTFDETTHLPTEVFFYGLKPQQEISVDFAQGKKMIIEMSYISEPNEEGIRNVSFKLNGQQRRILVKDKSIEVKVVSNKKANDPLEVGSPLQGKISQIYVKQGEVIEKGDALFVIEAMKMETTVQSPLSAEVKVIHLKEGTIVNQDDLVIEFALNQ